MIYHEFALEIAAILNRNPDDLIVHGVDLLTNSANAAKRAAEGLVDFERLRERVELVISGEHGGDLTTARSVLTGKLVSVNRIERAYMVGRDANCLLPVEFMTSTMFHAKYTRQYKQGLSESVNVLPVLVRQGNKLRFYGGQQLKKQTGGFAEPVTVVLDAVVFSEPFSTFSSTVTLETPNDDLGCDVLPPGGQVILTRVGVVAGAPFYTVIYDANNTNNGVLYCWFHTNQLNTESIPAPSFKTNRWFIGTHPFSLSYQHIYTQAEGTSTLFGGPIWLNGFDQTVTAASTIVRTGSIEQSGQDDPTNFWFNEGYQWLKFRVLRDLEYHNNTQNRFNVTQAMLNDAFAGFLAWNNSITTSGSAETYNLD